MKRHRASKTSQVLAATVTITAVLIMLTPLRRGPAASQPRQAGWLPLLNLGGMHDTAAFQRRDVSPSGYAASAAPLSRPASKTCTASTP